MIRRLLKLVAGFRPKLPSSPVDPVPVALGKGEEPVSPSGLRTASGEDRPLPTRLPASAVVAFRSITDLANARPTVETRLTFQRTRIGAAETFVCGLCSEVIVKASTPGVTYLLADHHRWHRNRGDI